MIESTHQFQMFEVVQFEKKKKTDARPNGE